MGKTKAHIRYKNKDGVSIPGVTTVLNILNKPALIKWANNLGLRGIDSSKYRDKMGDIGTLAHLMILEHLSGKKQDYSEYSKDDIDKAENCLISFFEWEKTNKIEPILIEEQLISSLNFGGIVDCFCKLNGVETLIDFKTGKAIYPEMEYQVAAYRQLIKENLKKMDFNVRILRIGRDENEGFEEKLCKNLDLNWDIFFYCLKIYETKNKIKNGSDDFYQFVREESKK